MHQLDTIEKSAVIKRSIIINGHETTACRLEDEKISHHSHGDCRLRPYDQCLCWWNISTAAATSAIYRLQFACSFSTVFRASDALAKSATCVEQSERTPN